MKQEADEGCLCRWRSVSSFLVNAVVLLGDKMGTTVDGICMKGAVS